MYTELKSYQIVIALLKKYGISKCVLSAGARNVPFVHSVEQDPYFECYSVVDERSAGYFALGLAQQSGEPVVISCTSSTAACNYWPPVAEAYYQNVPLVVLTSDRDPALLGQREDQMIDQVGMYDRHVRKSVNLPLVKTDDDFRFCQRLVNEALLELNHREGGPVHINVPMKWYSTSFTTAKLPEVTHIERIELEGPASEWEKKARCLRECKRVLVACGQLPMPSDELKRQLETFFDKYNCAISVEHMSNIETRGAINTFVAFEGKYVSQKRFSELKPDLVITFGGNIMQGLKHALRSSESFEHWSINSDGSVCDMFGGLTTIFECSPEVFFGRMNELASSDARNELAYYSELKAYVDSIKPYEFPWSNVYAIENVARRIPSGSILHLSINTAIRATNFFQLADGVRVYANIGTYGIDGCMSSLIGQAQATDDLAFLFIGDLAFFYDMNSLRIKHVGSNVRILLLNNHGGEEFYYNGMWQDEASDLHTSARHSNVAGPWAESCGFKYLSASDKESFDNAMPEFMAADSNEPVLFEVFTEMSADSQTIYDFYDASRPRDAVSDMKRAGKEFVKKTIGKETAVKIADKLGVKLR